MLRNDRPITSAQISSISAKVQTVPMAASASSTARTGSKACGPPPPSIADMSTSSAMLVSVGERKTGGRRKAGVRRTRGSAQAFAVPVAAGLLAAARMELK